MTWPCNHRFERQEVFIIDFTDGCDAVVRLLGLFAIQECRLQALEFEGRGDAARLKVRTAAMDATRAENLRLRLQGLPMVHGVSLGWRDMAVSDRIAMKAS